MDDFLASSDLCEENHFFRQAQLLRALAGEGGIVYIVAERTVDYDDQYNYLSGEGEPRTVFLDREEAERVANERNARFLREISLWQYGFDTTHFASMPEADLERRVGAILGVPFSLWNKEAEDDADHRTFPEWATDEQMIEISKLFDKLQLVRVIEAEFGAST